MSDNYTEFGPLKYDPQQIAQQGYGVATTGPQDSNKIVCFYRRSVLNAAKSTAEGRRICEDHDYVKIQQPGEAHTVVDRPIQESDKFRWPRQYAQYAQGKQQAPDGIPVTLLFPAHPSISDMLLHNNVHTIEQLANLSASGMQTIGMGCQAWVNKAQDYLKQAEKGVNFHKFEKTIAEKDQQIVTLQRQVNELAAQVQKIVAIAPQNQPLVNFDAQSAQIAAMKAQETFNQPPINMSHTIATGDINASTRQRKARSDRGVPRGPRKET